MPAPTRERLISVVAGLWSAGVEEIVDGILAELRAIRREQQPKQRRTGPGRTPRIDADAVRTMVAEGGVRAAMAAGVSKASVYRMIKRAREQKESAT